MKLELKHLGPYLPYMLNFIDSDKNEIYEAIGMYEDSITLYSVTMPTETFYFSGTTPYFKPLLIQLSELPKQAKATVVGIRNIDQINSKCCYLIYHKDGDTYFDDLPEQMAIEDVWDTYEQLFAGHYDVFGLIEQGLALNKLEYGQSK